MNVHISPLTAVLFVTSAMAAYLVYKATAKARGGVPGTGDLVGAIASGAVIFGVLIILFSGVTSEHNADPAAQPADSQPATG